MDLSLDAIYFGNTIRLYLEALGIFAVTFAVFGILQGLLLNRLASLAKKTSTALDDVAIRVVKSIKPGFYVYVAVFIGYQRLTFPSIVDTIAGGILTILIAYQVVLALHIIIDHVIETRSKGDDLATAAAYSFLAGLLKATLWVFAFLFVLSNFGVNITTLIAGLGIGGVAIAFALQNILGDLFSSFAIYFDKPFVAGDIIKVGDSMGTVERIGVKTTRLRSFQGEQLVFSNEQLTSEKIQNFGKMEERQTIFRFGVLYETSIDKVKKIPDMVADLFKDLEDVRFERVHFRELGDSSLVFEVTYYVLTPDYNLSLDRQQEINIGLMDRFKDAGIEFAYPTQTIYTKNA